MIDRMGRKRALAGLTLLAVGALTLLAPATAFAQLPTLSDPVGSTTDTVGSTTDTVGSTTDTVTKPVNDTVDDTTKAVDSTADPVTKPVKDTVDDTTGGVGGTIDDTTKKTTDTISGTVGGVQETADGVGGTVLNPDLGFKDRNGDGKISKKEKAAAQQKTATAKTQATLTQRAEKAADDAKNAALAKLERNRRIQGTPVTLTAPPPRESFLTQLADAAVEATKKLAFPLGLALMVGAFLMVQGRIDRKDAKLALAPIDSEQDLLSFQ